VPCNGRREGVVIPAFHGGGINRKAIRITVDSKSYRNCETYSVRRRERRTNMKGIKRIALIVALMIFTLPTYSLGASINSAIYASADEIRIDLGYVFPAYDSYPEAGFGIDYSDDYLITNLSFALKDDILLPGLILGLGLKGFVGEVDVGSKEFDLRAVSFQVLGEYDLRSKSANLPITISASFSTAPEAMCFSDTNRYSEFFAALYFYLVENGAIGIGYRNFEARFDDPSGEKKASDDSLFVGLRLRF
jgi:hypothetical protein